MFILELKHSNVFINWYTHKIISRIHSLWRHLDGKYRNAWGSWKYIWYWVGQTPRPIRFFFFKDPKYFRIFPQSVNITNNLNKLTMIKVNIIVFKIILSWIIEWNNVKWNMYHTGLVWSDNPQLNHIFWYIDFS